MYQKPQLEKLGAFRDLTRLGFNGADDQLGLQAIDGCDIYACPTAS